MTAFLLVSLVSLICALALGKFIEAGRGKK